MTGKSRGPESWIVVDLGFGDGGKGTVTDFLVRDRSATLVVRFNGGAQAGHNVVDPSGAHHTFAQLGSGTFVPGVRTHLSEGMVLHPGGMEVEAAHLQRKGVTDALERTTIDERALVISPFQQAAGRLRELARGAGAHGTCGVGVGEAVADALDDRDDVIRAGDLAHAGRLSAKLKAQQRRKRAELELAGEPTSDAAALEQQVLHDDDAPLRVCEHWTRFAGALHVVDAARALEILSEHERIVLEGAQGILLDERWGFHPHTTWSDCTPRAAEALLRASGRGLAPSTCLGVVRAYATRHGPGPFPTFDPDYAEWLDEPHNGDDGWQGRFRRGALDLVLLRYALAVAPEVDALAVTCLDQAAAFPGLSICSSYEPTTASDALFEKDADGRIRALSPGPADDLDWRRRLGAALATVTPVLESLGDGEPAGALLIERLRGAIQRPVALASHGPTAHEKRWLAET